MTQGANPGRRGKFKSKVLRRGASIEKTICFIDRELSVWRDDPDRKFANNENSLNEDLCHHLSANAIGLNMMVRFHHQPRQEDRRSSDISAHPNHKFICADGFTTTIYEPILLIEGKRLPTPGSGRKHEYVTGYGESTGGIQRFKQGAHGAKHAKAVIVGYVQKHDAEYWRSEINRWIETIVKNKADISCAWRKEEVLGEFSKSISSGTHRCESTHRRMKKLEPILLVHLWINLVSSKQQTAA